MRFCPNCGAQLDDGDKFCTNCGAKIEESNNVVSEPEVAQTATTEPVMTQYPVNKTNKFKNWIINNKLIAGIVAAVVVIVLVAGGIKMHKDNSEVFKGTTVEFSGDNGTGNARLTTQSQLMIAKRVAIAVGKKDGVDSKLLDKINNLETADDLNRLEGYLEDDAEDSSKLEKFAKDLDEIEAPEVEPNAGVLSNGDKVKLMYSKSTQNMLKNKFGINATPKTFTVSGLK